MQSKVENRVQNKKQKGTQNKPASIERKTEKPIDFVLIIIIILLLSLGIVMVLSASAPSALSESGNSYTYVTRQAIFAVAGLIAMYFTSKIDYRIYKKFYKIIYVFSVGILLLVLIPGIGSSANGATRWINLGFTQFQPSELTKIGLIIFYAGYLADHKDELRDFKKGFLKPLIFVAIPVGIAYFIQNHLSVGLVMGLITVIMMLVAGCRITHFIMTGLVVGGFGSGILGLYMASKGESAGAENFRIDRILSFMNPWDDPLGTGYQAIQSLYAIGSGGLFGAGLGESKQKYLYIPEPQNDFIFSILAEELGFIGCTIVIILFALFVWRGILIAMKAPDMFSSLLATGITALVLIQVVINIGVVTSSIPNTGMPLPFFSAGGTAIIILLAMCGILLNISKKTSKI